MLAGRYLFKALAVCLIILGILYAAEFITTGKVTFNPTHQYIFPDGMTPVTVFDNGQFLCQYGDIYITCEPEIVRYEESR